MLNCPAVKKSKVKWGILCFALLMPERGVQVQGQTCDTSQGEVVSCIDKGLTEVPSFTEADGAQIKKVYLRENEIQVLPNGCFDTLTEMTFLTLRSNKIKVLPATIFDMNTKLQQLHLYDNAITQFETGTFSLLTKLTGLFLTFQGGFRIKVGNVLTCEELGGGTVSTINVNVLPASQLTVNPSKCTCDPNHASFVEGMAEQFNDPVIYCGDPTTTTTIATTTTTSATTTTTSATPTTTTATIITTIITTTTTITTSTTTQTSTTTTITTASTATTSSSAKTTATDTVAVTTALATSTTGPMLPTKPDDNVNATGEENNADKYNGSAESIADNSDNDTAGGNISAPPTEPQKSHASTRTIVGVLAALILIFAVVGSILWRQNHAPGGGGIPHIVGQNGGVGRDVLPIYNNRMFNIDTSPSEVYLQPDALQPAWYDSQPGRRSTVSATEAGVVYAIPVDLQDDEGSGGNTDNNDYEMPLANYVIVGTGSSATINGGGGGGNHEYSTPEARSKAVPLLSLDLDGYVVDDTAHVGAGGAPGGVVYATPAADSDI